MKPHQVECSTCHAKVMTCLEVPDSWVRVVNGLRCRACQILARLVV